LPITHGVREHRPYSRHGTSQSGGASHRIMIALALISMLICTSKELTAKTIREGERRSASARSREDVSSSLVLVVEATPGIPNAIVRGALNEATAIWEPQRRDRVAPSVHRHLRAKRRPGVMLGDARGSVSSHDLRSVGSTSIQPIPRRDRVSVSRDVVQLLDAAAAYRNRPTSYRKLRRRGRSVEPPQELGHYLTGSRPLAVGTTGHPPIDFSRRTEYMLRRRRQLTARH
jgi:hypothetical protein